MSNATNGLVLQWLVALLLIAAPGLAWPCEESFSRPQCDASQLHSNMCFSLEMTQAVRKTESGAFREHFNQTVDQAQAYLNRVEPASNKVIITDLDETLLSNTGYYRDNPYFSPNTWSQWVSSNNNGPYLSKVMEFLMAAKQKGFSIMFITGRPSQQAMATLRQVSDFQWDGVFFRPTGMNFSSAMYKAQVRQMLRNMGYEIVLNIGDQPSDMDLPAEPEAGEFLLPNLMYSIP